MPNAGLDPYSCDCGWLERAANDPSIPIGFDPKVNEYYVETSGGLGQAIIKFCPWCGGDAPVSHRANLFAVITAEETLRIRELTEKLRTRTDVTAAWGAPDEEVHSGYVETEPAKDGAPARTITFDVMRYNNISPTAIVDVILRASDRVMFMHYPKLRQS